MSKFLSVRRDRVSYTRSVIVRVLVLGSFLNFISFHVSAQAELIKDIDQREEVLSNEYQRIAGGTSRVFFVSGITLYKTDGSLETTIKLKSFTTTVGRIVMVGNTAYFTANDGSGLELWKSNGTPSGTVRVKDIYPGTASSNPQSITSVGGVIYFTAENGQNGRELWKSDGTASGTVMVKDILRVTGSSLPSGLTNVNGTLYFAANNGSEGYELWKSDGTAEGTVMVKDIRPGSKLSSSPQSLTNSNGMLFFSATDEMGRELWKTDGTVEGTVRVKDLRLSGDSGIENLIDVNGTLFFTANDGVHGDELWKTNGTEAGTVLVKDMNPGSAGSNSEINFTRPGDMNNFRNINGKLFFIASAGRQDFIYRSDGTSEGTIRIMNAYGTGLNLADPHFTYLEGNVYFFNVDGSGEDYHPQRGPMYLWKMDINGTTATQAREFFTPYSYSDEFYYEGYDHAMIQCNGALYITARLESHLGFKLIKSDGTAAGTKILADPSVYTLASNPGEFVSVNGLVFFRTFPDPYNYVWPSEDDFQAEDLYRTDGTEAGTFRMPGGFQEWNEMEPVGNSLYYTADNGGWNLNKTDGTNITTVTTGLTGEGRPTQLTAVGNTLYYTNAYAQLWKTDGTSQGTVMMKDFFGIQAIKEVEGKAFILAETSTGGLELWRTNASGAVVRIKTIRTSAATRSFNNPTATRGHILYFVANDGVHGNEIWESDGTSSGTFMLHDLNTHDPVQYENNEADISSMVYTGGSLIINAMNAELLWAIHTYTPSSKMWTTTRVGDEAASPLIAVNNKAVFVSNNQLMAIEGGGALANLTDIGAHERVGYAVSGNHLYVSSVPYNHGLWRTDGTECGTIKIQTGIGSAFDLAMIGDHLIMGAGEPFIYRNIESLSTPCDAVAFTSLQETEIVMTPYPNPFTNNFTLRVHGEDEEVAEVAVFSSSGMPIEKLGTMKTNMDHPRIGSSWPNGMYYIKVNKAGKLTTHTVVKE